MARLISIVVALFLSAGTGCSHASSEILVTTTLNNLSDSYIYPFRLLMNGKVSFPSGGLRPCSNDKSGVGLVTVAIWEPPRFVVVEWEHLLSRKAYRARIDLSDAAGEWWNESPFRKADGAPHGYPPKLVIQWRGQKNVAAMLVADPYDFSKGRLELGEAEGVEIPRPEWGPRLYLTYEDLRRSPGDEYRVGQVRNYERRYDGSLPKSLRFGCPRLPGGVVDESRLPPEKLPFVIGGNGEYIPCDKYFCSDKQDLIKELRKLGWKRYPPGQTPPPIEFRDAPNPRPAW